MKHILICLFMVLGVMTHVEPYAAESERAARLAAKGFELYSWKRSDGTWQYSLLPGTNRNKTHDEIVATSVTIADVATLKTRLAALAIGEQVIWLTPGSELPLPGAAVVEDLVAYCRMVQVELHVAQ